ncbi:MAG: hypothetical protein P9M14_10870 [Candidatus Alcyoniella australis]|nr:hypothetical protein [Candidatus Alcyoniella australis]
MIRNALTFTLLAIIMQALILVSGCSPSGDNHWTTVTDPQVDLVFWLPPDFEMKHVDYGGPSRVIEYASPGSNLTVTLLPKQTQGESNSVQREQQHLAYVLIGGAGPDDSRTKDLGELNAGRIKGNLMLIQHNTEGQDHELFLFTFVHPDQQRVMSVAAQTTGECREYANCGRITRSIIEGLRAR